MSRHTQQGETRNTQTRIKLKIIVFNVDIRARQGKARQDKARLTLVSASDVTPTDCWQHVSFNLPYLLNDSQTIRSTINFSKPLLCMTIIRGDWSNWSHFHFIMPVMPDKAPFVRTTANLCTALLGKLLFIQLQKRHLAAKNELHFHSDQRENQVFPGLRMQQVGGQYANVSC